MLPKASVTMPAFNAEKYIGAAMHSVLSQQDVDLELIVVNDDSTDSTALPHNVDMNRKQMD